MKPFFVVLGMVSLVLGCIGIALPILPTTPFVLLSTVCFAKSSHRLNHWFKGTRLYKNNLESFTRGEGMTWKTKLRIMVTVTIIMGLGFFFMKQVPIGRICLGIVWIAHIIAFTFIIKTCPAQPKHQTDSSETH